MQMYIDWIQSHCWRKHKSNIATDIIKQKSVNLLDATLSRMPVHTAILISDEALLAY